MFLNFNIHFSWLLQPRNIRLWWIFLLHLKPRQSYCCPFGRTCEITSLPQGIHMWHFTLKIKWIRVFSFFFFFKGFLSALSYLCKFIKLSCSDTAKQTPWLSLVRQQAMLHSDYSTPTAACVRCNQTPVNRGKWYSPRLCPKCLNIERKANYSEKTHRWTGKSCKMFMFMCNKKLYIHPSRHWILFKFQVIIF